MIDTGLKPLNLGTILSNAGLRNVGAVGYTPSHAPTPLPIMCCWFCGKPLPKHYRGTFCNHTHRTFYTNREKYGVAAYANRIHRNLPLKKEEAA